MVAARGKGFEAGRLTIEEVAALTATNAAHAYGIYPQKGAIREGGDADLAIVPKDGPVRGFVPEVWVKQLDFATLEKVSGSYVSDDLRDREDDVIWRVRWGDEWLYVYLLLEFQSTVDPFMAVRVMVYLGLLYQDLINAKQFSSNGKMPAVLPSVLYNGQQRWQEGHGHHE